MVLELLIRIMQAIKMKQSRENWLQVKRSGKNHMQLILLLLEMTIKDNGYVSRQLDQQCKRNENTIQERKQLLKRKKKSFSVGSLETSPHTSKFDLTIFLINFCQTGG